MSMQAFRGLRKGENRFITIFAGLFMLAHGAVHVMLVGTPRIDGDAGNFLTQGGSSWLFGMMGLDPPMIDAVGTVLIILAGVGFCIAGMGFLRMLKISSWRQWAIVSGLISLFALLAFWNDWMVAGAVIDFGVVFYLFKEERTIRSLTTGVAQ